MRSVSGQSARPERPGGPGEMLRFWRARRRVSQMDLAHAAGVSTRHLSFVETGRAGASRELLGALAEELDIPLRERNALLLAAGYAPAYTERPLDDDALGPVRDALRTARRRARPVPGARRGPVGRRAAGRPRRRPAARRAGPGGARAAGERLPSQPAPGRARAADPQPGPVARAPAAPPRTAGPGDRGPAAHRVAHRVPCLPGPGHARPAVPGGRRAAAAAPGHRRR